MENNDIASMISKIVQNPEFAGMVNDLRGSGQNNEDTSKEMLEKLPDVMAMISPLIGGEGGDKPPREGEKDGERDREKDGHGERAQAPSPHFPGKTGKYDKVRATKLMQALKPYLSRERAEIVDKCVSVMQITDVVDVLGGLDGLLKTK